MTVVSQSSTISQESFITSYSNIHIDHPDNFHTEKFLAFLSSSNLIQLVPFSTHHRSHTLHWLFTATNPTLISIISYQLISPSYKFLISLNLTSNYMPSTPNTRITHISFEMCYASEKINYGSTNMLLLKLNYFISHLPAHGFLLKFMIKLSPMWTSGVYALQFYQHL